MEKGEMRTAMKSLGTAGVTDGREVLEGLFGWLSKRLPGTIAAYLAMETEVDVSALFSLLPGWRWVLPRVSGRGELAFRDRDVPMETHPYGMRQPADVGPDVPVSDLDVILVPGLAFDRSGGRLGRGGGYYDRVLASKRGDCETVGVTVMERIVDAIPMAEHDQRVGWIAAQNGVMRCTPTI